MNSIKILIGVISLLGITFASQFDESNSESNQNSFRDYPARHIARYEDDSPPPRIHHKRKCQSERFEHQVIMKKYSDSTGYWVLYTQIVETRNVANHCNRNEYVYLAKRKRTGWLWNPKINSLVHYSLGEPKFISRKVDHPDRPYRHVIVNMSRNYASQSVDLDRLFPIALARNLSRIAGDDLKWSELARSSLPILQMETAYFQLVTAKENTGSQHLHVLDNHKLNHEVLE